MSRPATLEIAKREVQLLLDKRLQGHGATRRRVIQDAQRIMEVIYRRFAVGIYQLRVKHLRWYLDHATKNFSPGTRNNKWYTVCRLIEATGKEDDWKPLLRGPWVRKNGNYSKPTNKRRPARKAAGPKKTQKRVSR